MIVASLVGVVKRSSSPKASTSAIPSAAILAARLGDTTDPSAGPRCHDLGAPGQSSRPHVLPCITPVPAPTPSAIAVTPRCTLPFDERARAVPRRRDRGLPELRRGAHAGGAGRAAAVPARVRRVGQRRHRDRALGHRDRSARRRPPALARRAHDRAVRRVQATDARRVPPGVDDAPLRRSRRVVRARCPRPLRARADRADRSAPRRPHGGRARCSRWSPTPSPETPPRCARSRTACSSSSARCAAGERAMCHRSSSTVIATRCSATATCSAASRCWSTSSRATSSIARSHR